MPKYYSVRSPWKTTEELKEKIEEYFNSYCESNKVYPTITGLAWYLGTNRMTLLNWIKSKDIESKTFNFSKEDKDLCIKYLLDAYSYIEKGYEENLFYKDSFNGCRFTLSNNYKWVDKQVIESDNTNKNIDFKDLSEQERIALKNKALEALEDED